MATFAELKTAIDNIAGRMAQNTVRINTGRDQVNAAVIDLTAMGTAYTAILADVEAGAAANPANAAWDTLKAEKDILVAEFGTQKTEAEALKAAMDAN